ncbi:hypothetical protein F511_32131 [Dorcoceras hygrometricum]|uniref:Uncharacterized protein n=1 Tax=Dorcoceras hygrometricum TaxID=472368 RepID=A0A2Z7AVC5_9LAMI|nr:hypothetical protein F511_32131 [Dorcoceras hygrometricum]
MRIRPPELETSICDVKYHVSLVAAGVQAGQVPRCELVHWPKCLNDIFIDCTIWEDIEETSLDRVFPCPSAITSRWFSDTTDQLVTTPMIALYLSGTTHLSAGHSVALSQVLNRSKAHRNHLPKSSRTLGSSFAKKFDQHCYFAFLCSVDSGHLIGINRKSYSIRAHRHQSCSKQRRKSTAINRRRVRMNSNYRGFTGENDEEYRVQIR